MVYNDNGVCKQGNDNGVCKQGVVMLPSAIMTIIIIAYSSGFSGNGKIIPNIEQSSVTTQRYDSEDACVESAKIILDSMKDKYQKGDIHIFCTKAG